jgi:hypothetical protein
VAHRPRTRRSSGDRLLRCLTAWQTPPNRKTARPLSTLYSEEPVMDGRRQKPATVAAWAIDYRRIASDDVRSCQERVTDQPAERLYSARRSMSG